MTKGGKAGGLGTTGGGASAIGSFGFQRFYNLGNLEKAQKNLETRLAGNSSLVSQKLISETVYRNLQNLQKPGKPQNMAMKYL